MGNWFPLLTCKYSLVFGWAQATNLEFYSDPHHIQRCADYLTYSHGGVWSPLTPTHHFLSLGALHTDHSRAGNSLCAAQPRSQPGSINYQIRRVSVSFIRHWAVSKHRECFLIYVSNSVLSNWYLAAKFGQKGLLRLKIIFLTRSVNWSVSPGLQRFFSIENSITKDWRLEAI